MYSEICPGLFCGNASASLAPENEIFDCIINVATEVPISKCLRKDVSIHKFEIIDDQNDDMQFKMLHIFPETCRIINQCLLKKQNILIHCLEAKQRSATVIAAFLLQKMAMPNAMSLLSEKHPPAFDFGEFVHFSKALYLWCNCQH